MISEFIQDLGTVRDGTFLVPVLHNCWRGQFKRFENVYLVGVVFYVARSYDEPPRANLFVH